MKRILIRRRPQLNGGVKQHMIRNRNRVEERLQALLL
jgi:hypothetical protein